MNDLNSFLFSLKKSLNIRSSNIDEVIQDFDRRHTGVLTIPQFQRLISSCGIFLSPKEYEHVIKSFSTSTNMIDLKQFSDAVKNSHEETQSVGDVMRNNLIDLHNRLSRRSTSLRDILRSYDRNNRGYINKYDFIRAVGSFPSSRSISEAFSKDDLISLNILYREYDKINGLSESSPQITPQVQHKEAPPAVENAHRITISRNINLRDTFHEIDRLRTGKMSQSHFQTALINSGIHLPPSEVTDLTNYYRCDSNLIDYLQFLSDNDKYRQEHSRPSTNYSPTFTAPFDLNATIQQISRELFHRKLHPSQLFQTNSSLLTKNQFTASFRLSRLNLTYSDVENLCKSFSSSNDDFVDVSRFISAVESAMAADPSLMQSGFRGKSANSPNADEVLNRLSASLSARKVQLSPRFMRFDREGSGEFNISLVNTVLKSIGLDALSDAELDALREKFPGKVFPNVMWAPLTAAVDPVTVEVNSNSGYGEMKGMSPIPSDFTAEEQQTMKMRMAESQRRTPDASLVPAMRYIKQTAARLHMNMIDEFHELDRMHVGFLKPTVFTSFISQNFGKLSQQHIGCILDNYGKFEFRYNEFCRDLERCGDESRTSCDARDDSKSSNVYKALLRRLKAFCTIKMMSPIEIFSTQDKSRLGFVESSHLEGCFSYFQIPVSKEEIEFLIKMFKDKEHEERIFYRQITADIENTQIDPSKARLILNETQVRKDADVSNRQLVLTIREKLGQRNRNIRLYFRDAERGKLMKKSEFVSRLEMANIVIPSDDLDNLVDKYSSKEIGNGDDPKVDWEEFVNDVENSRFFQNTY